jgi:hypothetical protein
VSLSTALGVKGGQIRHGQGVHVFNALAATNASTTYGKNELTETKKPHGTRTCVNDNPYNKIVSQHCIGVCQKASPKAMERCRLNCALLSTDFDSANMELNVLTRELMNLARTTHWAMRPTVIIANRPTPTRKLRLQSAQVRTHITTDIIVQ